MTSENCFVKHLNFMDFFFIKMHARYHYLIRIRQLINQIDNIVLIIGCFDLIHISNFFGMYDVLLYIFALISFFRIVIIDKYIKYI